MFLREVTMVAEKPKTSFKKLVEIMVKADFERWQKYLKGEIFPWDAPNYSSDMDIVSRTVSREGKPAEKGIVKRLARLGKG